MEYLLSIIVIGKDVIVCCILFCGVIVRCEFMRTKLVKSFRVYYIIYSSVFKVYLESYVG